MTLKIGEKIKNLRKQQDVTQEKLAAYLNISYQAVSKWENGTALPDITLIPQIANFFGVSADELLGMKDTEETEELKKFEEIYQENRQNGKIMDNIELSRKVIEKYPRNYQWLINLAYSLTGYCNSSEQIEYGKNHGFKEETIDICKRVLDDCTVDSIRHSAIQILCYTYSELGQKHEALNLADKMPDIYICKESLLTHIYDGEEQIKQCQENLLTNIDFCAGEIFFLVNCTSLKSELTVSEKIKYFEASVTLLKTILQDAQNCLYYSLRLKQLYIELSVLWCLTQDRKNAMKYLLLAEKCVADFDKCDNIGKVQYYNSLFVNRCSFNPKSMGKNYEYSEKELLLKILKERDEFDILRDLDEFKNLKNRLKA